jgi:hypothetical protein
MKISLRIPNGWTPRVKNKGKETCDIDGARLWIGPGSQIYCDQNHDPNNQAIIDKIAETSRS